MQLGLEREISDEEEEQIEKDEFDYQYETEEIEEIDENENENPLMMGDENTPNGAPDPFSQGLSRLGGGQDGYKQYDQLRQDDGDVFGDRR